MLPQQLLPEVSCSEHPLKGPKLQGFTPVEGGVAMPPPPTSAQEKGPKSSPCPFPD